ncbi:hypothetical protein CRUP_008307 [Coryphaenoides rupestris]|nr:hypothetical protein CRUP_008307 [Coryphaenoides rupestris]
MQKTVSDGMQPWHRTQADAVLNEHHTAGPPDQNHHSPADPELRSEPGAAPPPNSDPPAARDQDLEDVLREAEQIRLDVQQIQRDVCDLREAHAQAASSSNRHDHDSTPESAENGPGSASATAADIGMRIKGRIEAALWRLHGMRALAERLEAERGADSAVARIARAQGRGLGHALREAVRSYNDVELSRRESCRRHIRRQLEIVGGDVPFDAELLEEEMLEEDGDEGGVKVFGVGPEGRTARSALVDIESRDRELRQLERGVRGVQEVFLDMAVLTVEQGEVLESIQTNIGNTEAAVQETVGHLERANKHDSNNPFKRLFCACFPCYKS